MKVSELISMLKDCNPDSEVVFKPNTSSYVSTPRGVEENVPVRNFWGSDFESTVILCNEPVGSI